MSGLDPIKVNAIMDRVQRIRASNNNNWIDLIRLALIYAPAKETEKIINEIMAADNRVIAEFAKLRARYSGDRPEQKYVEKDEVYQIYHYGKSIDEKDKEVIVLAPMGWDFNESCWIYCVQNKDATATITLLETDLSVAPF